MHSHLFLVLLAIVLGCLAIAFERIPHDVLDRILYAAPSCSALHTSCRCPCRRRSALAILDYGAA